ncbi:MAG: ABC transporter ATP-binding protein [Bacillota bacterium]
MTDNLLDIHEAVIRYGAAVAVSGVSMAVGDGQVVALLGANGAGKSSLLKAVSGLVPLSGGAVTYAGQDLTRVPGYRRARVGMAHVPEGRRIFGELSVTENLLVGGYGRSKAELRRRLDGIFQRFPVLAERRNQMGGSLSGGEQQLLAIGRALMSKPRLLLLDEPSLGLSPVAVERVYEMIRQVHQEGVSILLVEQNARLAMTVADRVYVLRTGKVVLSGDSGNIRSQEELMRAYLGSPVKEAGR